MCDVARVIKCHRVCSVGAIPLPCGCIVVRDWMQCRKARVVRIVMYYEVSILNNVNKISGLKKGTEYMDDYFCFNRCWMTPLIQVRRDPVISVKFEKN